MSERIIWTWQRNPQSADTEHAWVQYFADPKLYRDVRWEVKADGMYYSAEAVRTPQHAGLT